MGLLLSITVFVGFGVVFVFVNMLLGGFIRPKVPTPEKASVYECGEPVIGSSWVQFDLRFYIVALVFLIFDVEVALFYPWAVAWGSADKLVAMINNEFAGSGVTLTLFRLRATAFIDMMFFFGVLLVGFAYLWRFGYLDWVRSAATTSLKVSYPGGVDLSKAARVDQA